MVSNRNMNARVFYWSPVFFNFFFFLEKRPDKVTFRGRVFVENPRRSNNITVSSKHRIVVEFYARRKKKLVTNWFELF